MARKFLTNIDLTTSELQNAVIQNLAADPTTGNKDGRIYYNTATDKLRVYANGSWIDVGAITSVAGTTNEITVSIADGVATIGLPDTVTITDGLNVGGNLVVTGDLTVNGTTTTVNTQNLNVEDNIITLNYGVTGAPTLNSGIEVERGDSPNVEFRWNETTDTWEASRDGSNYAAVILSGDDIPTSDVSGFDEAAQDAIGTILFDSGTIDFTYNDSTPSITANIIRATSNSYLSTVDGLAVDIASLEAKLVTDSFTKKASANVGNGVATSFAITHNLGTRDVVVNVYDNATYETVETDVVRTDTNNVTITFASAPATDAYRVVIVG